DLAAKRVLFATPGHDKSTWARFVEALEKHNGHRHAITQASMDMSAAYANGVREHCRNAEVVYDKFHVLAYASKAVDKVRRAEASSGIKGIWDALYKSQWLWRKNPENLSPEEQERLGKIQAKSVYTAKAYQMRPVLQEIYQSPRGLVAQHRF